MSMTAQGTATNTTLVIKSLNWKSFKTFLKGIGDEKRKAITAIESRGDLSDHRKDVDLSLLACLPNLKTLCVDDIDGDVACEQLSRVTTLEGLKFRGRSVTHAGLEYLRSLTELKAVEFSENKLFSGAEFYAYLAEFEWLSKIVLGNHASEEGLRYLASLEGLYDFHGGCNYLSENAISSIARFSQLKALSIAIDSSVDPLSLSPLDFLRNLEELTVSFHDMSLENVATCFELFARIPKLRTLKVYGLCLDVQQDTFAALDKSRSLRKLELSWFNKYSTELQGAILSQLRGIAIITDTPKEHSSYYNENELMLPRKATKIISS